jgi:hypothetical protein
VLGLKRTGVIMQGDGWHLVGESTAGHLLPLGTPALVAVSQ